SIQARELRRRATNRRIRPTHQVVPAAESVSSSRMCARTHSHSLPRKRWLEPRPTDGCSRTPQIRESTPRRRAGIVRQASSHERAPSSFRELAFSSVYLLIGSFSLSSIQISSAAAGGIGLNLGLL